MYNLNLEGISNSLPSPVVSPNPLLLSTTTDPPSNSLMLSVRTDASNYYLEGLDTSQNSMTNSLQSSLSLSTTFKSPMSMRKQKSAVKKKMVSEDSYTIEAEESDEEVEKELPKTVQEKVRYFLISLF